MKITDLQRQRDELAAEVTRLLRVEAAADRLWLALLACPVNTWPPDVRRAAQAFAAEIQR